MLFKNRTAVKETDPKMHLLDRVFNSFFVINWWTQWQWQFGEHRHGDQQANDFYVNLQRLIWMRRKWLYPQVLLAIQSLQLQCVGWLKSIQILRAQRLTDSFLSVTLHPKRTGGKLAWHWAWSQWREGERGQVTCMSVKKATSFFTYLENGHYMLGPCHWPIMNGQCQWRGDWML